MALPIVNAVRWGLRTPMVERSPPSGSIERHVIFFDGDSRGNPSAGGSEAVIVGSSRGTTSAWIIWAGGISYAHCTTTNNYAEYQGFVCGLHAALRMNTKNLHVVGDSTLILGQLKQHRVPRSAKLKPLYLHARYLADLVGVEGRVHHYRSHNKMADYLTNQAMDTKRSAQDSFPTRKTQLQEIVEWLHNDFGFWAEGTLADGDDFLSETPNT